ncbi:ribosomal protein S6 [Melioribacter roseus P3M-2]|uniref:Small ribosomal subunit protein bS6 n=1 Tax=Melioribacter roseus (strain DSM 23840 / JCM 17771 / VKM B-2668 / P3M-2) TaxID=1191523 RepID=I6ZST3_MELRP|nr:30S ribosomal protein S6 [Melioribacter roseus]AFN75099.1 ribosomal protein S6 [Melioribacter roseus P3M-2]
MRIRTYESVVVLNAALEDDQIESILKRIEEIITSNGGEILDIDKWGRKRLAYPIQKAKSGYYAIFRFKAPTELIKELERNYRLDENIIRFLTILLDKFALEAIAKKKESAENENSGDSETNNESKE